MPSAAARQTSPKRDKPLSAFCRWRTVARATAERRHEPPAPPSDLPRLRMKLRQATAANPAQMSSTDALKQPLPPAPAARQVRRWSVRHWSAARLCLASQPHGSRTLPRRQSLHQERKTRQPQLESVSEPPPPPQPQLRAPVAAPAAKTLPGSVKQSGRSDIRLRAVRRPAHLPDSPRRQL